MADVFILKMDLYTALVEFFFQFSCWHSISFQVSQYIAFYYYFLKFRLIHNIYWEIMLLQPEQYQNIIVWDWLWLKAVHDMWLTIMCQSGHLGGKTFFGKILHYIMSTFSKTFYASHCDTWVFIISTTAGILVNARVSGTRKSRCVGVDSFGRKFFTGSAFI